MSSWSRQPGLRGWSLAAAVSMTLLAAPAVSAEALLAAAREGDTRSALRELERTDEAALAAEADGTTALHWAVYHEDLALVERLIAAGADVDARNVYGSTPIGEAAAIGHAAIIERLLDAGADVNTPGPDGQTPLMAVVRTDRVDAARLLIERGADVNAREQWRQQSAIIWAAAQGQPAMVALLLEHGADPNDRSAANDWDRQVNAEKRRMYRPYGGFTALMYAAREGCVGCVQALVERGADPDLPGPRGETPLIVAINNFRFDVASALIDAGAAVNKWDWWGRTPLYSAVDMNTLPQGGRPDRRSADHTTSLELIDRLLAAGANPDLQLKLIPPYRDRGADRGCDELLTTGATPLLRAAKTFDLEAMSRLIAAGAQLDLPNENGVTPLMAAAGYASLECDIRGYGPGIPHYQTDDVEQRSIEALVLLLEAGARIDARTSGGRRGLGAGQTALFGAAFWGWNDVVRYLVDQGADVHATDAEDRTAIDAALGRAGGHDRGSSELVFEETAALLESLATGGAAANQAAPN